MEEVQGLGGDLDSFARTGILLLDSLLVGNVGLC